MGLSSDSVTLHRIIFYICCGISAIVVSVLLYSLIKLRHSNNNARTNFHKYLVIDLFWTIFPFLILVALIFPAARLLLS
jgi:cytochrome c oxidase subunit 2